MNVTRLSSLVAAGACVVAASMFSPASAAEQKLTVDTEANATILENPLCVVKNLVPEGSITLKDPTSGNEVRLHMPSMVIEGASVGDLVMMNREDDATPRMIIQERQSPKCKK